MRTRLVTAAVAAVLAVAGCTATADRPRAADPLVPSTTATPPGAAGLAAAQPVTALAGRAWRLLTYTRPGKRPGRPTVRATLHFGLPADDATGSEPGTSAVRAAGCNTLDGRVRLAPGHYEIVPPLARTSVACSTLLDFDDAVFRVVGSRRVEWTVDGTRLRLRADGVGELEYEAIEGPVRTLASGRHAGWRYRLYVRPAGYGHKVGLAVRDADGRAAYGGAAGEPYEYDAPALTVFHNPLAGAAYAGGFAPRGTARITHRATPNGAATDLATYDLPDGRWRAFGGVVPAHTRVSTLTAYGRGGRVLATWPSR